MTTTARRAGRAARDTHALISILGRYWLTVFPVAQGELRRIRALADAIPDPVLRECALATLDTEQANAEGAAIFATLVPRRHRSTVVRLLVLYQVMYDYLDTLTEQPVLNTFSNNVQLHEALTAALGGLAPQGSYYLHHPRHDDGDYLDGLVTTCRQALCTLPAAAMVVPHAHSAARRSAAGQSHNHAAMLTDSSLLTRWARRVTPPGSGLHWWETAAAAGSSLAIHALLAAAGDARTTRADAKMIEAVYWPWINGLNTLLESLIDRDEDRRTENHSFVGHYGTHELASRLGTMTRQATHMVRTLPRHRQHAVILAAMSSLYLSAPQASSPDLRAVVSRVRAELDIDVRPLLAMLRLRRLLARRKARVQSTECCTCSWVLHLASCQPLARAIPLRRRMRSPER